MNKLSVDKPLANATGVCSDSAIMQNNKLFQEENNDKKKFEEMQVCNDKGEQSKTAYEGNCPKHGDAVLAASTSFPTESIDKKQEEVKLQAILMSMDLDLLIATYGQPQTPRPHFKLKNEFEQRFLDLQTKINSNTKTQILISPPGNDLKIILAKFIKKILFGLIEDKTFEYACSEAEALLQKKPEFASLVKVLSTDYELSYHYLLKLTEFGLKVNNTVTGWGAWMRSFLTYWLSDRSGSTYHMYNQKFLWLASNVSLKPLEVEASKLLMQSLTLWLVNENNPHLKNILSETTLAQPEFKELLLEFCLSLSKKENGISERSKHLGSTLAPSPDNGQVPQAVYLNAALHVSVSIHKPENTNGKKQVEESIIEQQTNINKITATEMAKDESFENAKKGLSCIIL